MKQHFPKTRSLYRRIIPTNSAEAMFYLGDSARFKIIRAVQLHNMVPPVTDETRRFTPLLNFLSEGVEGHWMVQQQYSSCKWAAPKDQELATSLLLHYGWARKYPDHKLADCCIYQLRRADDGIHLIISEPHTFDARLFAGCTRAHSIAESFKARNKHAPYDILFREACRVFFSYNNYYISMTADYRQAVMNKIQAFCQRLTNALAVDDKLVYPSIDQPENLFEVEYNDYGEPREYVMKWEDFILENSATSAMVEQRRANNEVRKLDAADVAYEKLKRVLEPDKEYTGAQIKEHVSWRILKSGVEIGFIIPTRKVGRTQYYKLDYERS